MVWQALDMIWTMPPPIPFSPIGRAANPFAWLLTQMPLILSISQLPIVLQVVTTGVIANRLLPTLANFLEGLADRWPAHSKVFISFNQLPTWGKFIDETDERQNFYSFFSKLIFIHLSMLLIDLYQNPVMVLSLSFTISFFYQQ